MRTHEPAAQDLSGLHEELRRIADERFGIDALHAGQLEAMSAVARGRDLLAVMPTGYGKSAIYQVVAALGDRLAVVVSPLIALQRDQVESIAQDLGSAGVAVAINSTLSAAETAEAWQAAEDGTARYLFLSPEQLANDKVVERVAALHPGMLVVDEAHCVSAWGHDFRPDYLSIGSAIGRLGRPVVVALTATAAPPVREEIVERLELDDPVLVVRGFDRPNLDLDVRRSITPEEKRRALLAQVIELATSHAGLGLVYVARRREAEEYAARLAEQGVRAAAYHAGLPADEREAVQESFANGGLDVIVATSAFGMGIDQPNVRFVVHASPPGSLDDYYQEIGRAGRDGDPAVVTLHYRPEELSLRRFFSSQRLDEDDLLACLDALRAGQQSAAAVRRSTGLSPRRAGAAVNLLVLSGAAERRGTRLRQVGSVTAGELLARAGEIVEARERVATSRVEMMRGYAETTECRRQYLLGYFGETYDPPCDHCDNCRDHPEAVATHDSAEGEAPFPLQSQVHHAQWGDGTVMRVEDDRLTVFFPAHGYRTLELGIVTSKDLLTRLDDPPGARHPRKL